MEVMSVFTFAGFAFCFVLAVSFIVFGVGFLIWKFTGKPIGFKLMALSQVMPERMHKFCNKFTGENENSSCNSDCKDKFCKYCSKH